jgi:hypothetical protein
MRIHRTVVAAGDKTITTQTVETNQGDVINGEMIDLIRDFLDLPQAEPKAEVPAPGWEHDIPASGGDTIEQVIDFGDTGPKNDPPNEEGKTWYCTKGCPGDTHEHLAAIHGDLTIRPTP